MLGFPFSFSDIYTGRSHHMEWHRALRWMVAAQLLWATAALAQYKAETVGAPPADVPNPLQALVDPQGTRAVDGQGTTVCEVWLRKALPANPNPNSSSDVLYGAIAEGMLLGVLHFPAQAADFRGQALKPGFYTMRYVLIPQDGNHMGVNPYRDVIVLGPVAADTTPDAVLKFDALVKLSRLASGTPHPALLVMAPVGGENPPSVVKDDQGHWNLQVKLHGQSGDIPIAVTVVGKWEAQ
jgi:hypothetical protein